MDIVSRQIQNCIVHANPLNGKIIIETPEKVINKRADAYRYLQENRIPIQANFEITGKCNLDCYYCMAKNCRSMKDLDTNQIKIIIDYLYSIGVIFLEITGGEPLLRKDFIEIIEYLKSKNMVLRLLTNGTLLTEEIIVILKECNLQSISVSLLTPNREKCDELTGVEGSFDRIVRALRLIKKHNLPLKVNVSLTNQNIIYFEEFEKLSDELSIKFSYGTDVLPSYDSNADNDQYRLNKSHKSYLRKYCRTQGNINSMKELICGSGMSQLAIDAEGYLMPCIQFRKRISNVLYHGLEDIWYSDALLEIVSKGLKRDVKCGECKYLDYCYYCPGIMNRYTNEYGKCSENVCRRTEIIYESFISEQSVNF